MPTVLTIHSDIALGATTGIHKLLGPFPPDWFREKFSDSLIGWAPGGIELSFGIIVFLELAIAGLFTIALIKREFAKGTPKI
jgi:hypothetical protein